MRKVLDDDFMLCEDCYMVGFNHRMWSTPNGVPSEFVQLRTQEVKDAIKALPGRIIKGNWKRDVCADQVPPCDCCRGESFNSAAVGSRYHFVLVERDQEIPTCKN